MSGEARGVADPYVTLGVPRDATPEAIHLAYHRLAMRCHPDLYPGDARAQARFVALSAANNVLTHGDLRRRFDREAMADSIAARGPLFSAPRAPPANPVPPAPDGRDKTWRAAEPHYNLNAEFLDAVNGATVRMTLPDGARLDVRIPPGTADGEVLRQHRRGLARWFHGSAGDTLIEIHVNPHWRFVRHGQDIELDVAVTLAEAVLGGSVTMATPGGPVRLHIPAGSANGTKLRLSRRGVPTHNGQATGDLYATLRVVLGTGAPGVPPG